METNKLQELKGKELKGINGGNELVDAMNYYLGLIAGASASAAKYRAKGSIWYY